MSTVGTAPEQDKGCKKEGWRAVNFAEEGLHLAAAFQVAGFAHVIGSLQPADDDACAIVARLLYKHLVGNCDSVHASGFVAEALHYALSEGYRQMKVRPIDWAPCIHMGEPRSLWHACRIPLVPPPLEQRNAKDEYL